MFWLLSQCHRQFHSVVSLHPDLHRPWTHTLLTALPRNLRPWASALKWNEKRLGREMRIPKCPRAALIWGFQTEAAEALNLETFLSTIVTRWRIIRGDNLSKSFQLGSQYLQLRPQVLTTSSRNGGNARSSGLPIGSCERRRRQRTRR
jgi:hypothetical protein